MQVRPEELASTLQSGLRPAYLIAGDETLLVEEAASAIRAVAQAEGFSERRVMFAESGFDWGQLLEEGAAMSLFAERKLVELRLPSGKPGAETGIDPDHRFNREELPHPTEQV